jgi:Pup-ligase protein
VPLKPFLMGNENEYSVAVTGRGQSGPSAEQLAVLLAHAAREHLICLPDATANGSVFLTNGGRFYIDFHAHPEYCTPECSTPEQIAAHDIAGERILLMLAAKLKAEWSIDLTIVKNNLSSVLPDTATFGNHESYVCWVDLSQAAEAMMAHLVSRLPYAGAGCLSAHPGGMGFELSQRARHLVRSVGEETTRDRAIFCTRVRKASDVSPKGWIRAHLISKDSQRAPFGNYLTFGTTGLLFWILNHGGSVGRRLQLVNPVQALRAISLDPWLKARVPLADGRKLTALEIQYEYLAECENFGARHELPPWSSGVLRCWREVLASLARNPMEQATRLDAYAKLLIMEHEVRRAGFSWTEVRNALMLLDDLRRKTSGDELIRALVAEVPGTVPADQQQAYAALLAHVRAAGPRALDHLRFAIRLQVLDFKYHELGGMYDRLALQGKMDSVVINSDDIQRAVTTAPPNGRASARGELVKTYHRKPDWGASWDFVIHGPSSVGFDLSDPFSADSQSTTFNRPANVVPQADRISTLMSQFRQFFSI